MALRWAAITVARTSAVVVHFWYDIEFVYSFPWFKEGIFKTLTFPLWQDYFCYSWWAIITSEVTQDREGNAEGKCVVGAWATWHESTFLTSWERRGGQKLEFHCVAVIHVYQSCHTWSQCQAQHSSLGGEHTAFLGGWHTLTLWKVCGALCVWLSQVSPMYLFIWLVLAVTPYYMLF